MAEVKNAFIKSKMNKDLDNRLLPSGEYREAVNAQVSKSEGSDVGSLENTLGNMLLQEFEASVPNTSSIGYFVNESKGDIYIFITDNETSGYVTSGAGSNHFIYKYNTITNTSTKLLEGAFLNFSKLNPIYGVNLLENLLFWTDNRNQPRKINIIDGATPSYYTTEDQISVAKYNPYKVIELFKESDLSTGDYETTMKDVVSKFLPNGGSCVTTADVSGGSAQVTVDQLQIPYYTLNGEPVIGWSVKKVDSSGNIVSLQYNGSDVDRTVAGYSETGGIETLTLSGVFDIDDNTELIFNPNPYYINGYNGDPRFLEDKFVRFSYRFKFDDGEYSLIAPFTQVCFIPKQDGYFLNESEFLGDMQQAYASTIVDFMENKVNKIDLRIPLPSNASSLSTDFHIEEIDILYKESDGLAIQVVETIKANTPEFTSITGDTYEYQYQSQKPYKTLPAKDTTRVYDKVPVKAFSQEVISNRVVYGNYQDKHTPPDFLNYNVAATAKSDFSSTDSVSDTTSKIEYPNSTLKTNRTYQVGVVLSDKFGRSSSTILSNATNSISVGPAGSQTTFSGSTLYLPYSDEGVDMVEWVGNSLKVIFNSTIGGDANPATNAPGVYNGDASSSDYNPLGWYSYKIVVKQTEQEYYNVFSAGAMKALPYDYATSGASYIDKNTSFISLLNDNINKIPRDLSQVGPQDKSFRSSVELYGRVENTAAAYSNTASKQFYPGKKSFTSSSIEDLYDMFDVVEFKQGTNTIPVTDVVNPFSSFYKSDSNPLIARITTSQSVLEQFGVLNVSSNGEYPSIENISIFETKPVESRLDIYWETSTTGLVSDLNTAILTQDNGAAFISDFNLTPFTEAITLGSEILSSNFTIADILGTNIPPGDFDSDITMTVTDTQATPQFVNNYFNLVKIDSNLQNYNITVTQAFIDDVYFGDNAGLRNFVFTFYVNVRGNDTETFVKQADLRNIVPTITSNGGMDISMDVGNNVEDLYSLFAVNGALAVNNKQLYNLDWDIVSGNDDNYFSLGNANTSTCTVYNDYPSTIPAANYPLVIRVVDANNSQDTINFNVNFLANVTSVVEWRATTNVGGSDPVDYYYCIIGVSGWGQTARNGWYIYSNTWNSFNGSTKQINYTGSNKDGTGCSGSWYFNADATSVTNHWKSCVLGSNPASYSGTTINITGVDFTII